MKLGRITSDVIIVIYVMATLYFRFLIEPYLGGNFILSVLIGISALAIIWILVKIKFLNPSWFGLIKEKKTDK